MDLWVEFDQKSFPLEAEFADPGPVEGINFGGALKFKRRTLSNTFVIQTEAHTVSHKLENV